MSTLVDKVLEVVQRKSPGTTRVQEIMEKVEATAGGVYATLSQMVDKGRLVRVSPGVYGLPSDGHAPIVQAPAPAPLPTSLVAPQSQLPEPPAFGVIEQGIPVPAPRRKAAPMGDLARRMQPGDSVLLATKHQAQMLCREGKRLGLPMTARQVEGGHRVWRLEASA